MLDTQGTNDASLIPRFFPKSRATNTNMAGIQKQFENILNAFFPHKYTFKRRNKRLQMAKEFSPLGFFQSVPNPVATLDRTPPQAESEVAKGSKTSKL